MKSELKIEVEESVRDGEYIKSVKMHADGGVINCRLHKAVGGDAAIVWVFGSGGGLGGPAGGVYERLAERFHSFEISSLQLDYRRPGYLNYCVQDVLIGIEYLASIGKTRIVLVGHSFGGAVVISAGISSSAAIAVAALSSQTSGTEHVSRLAPKPLLLIHGKADEILPFSCSQYIYRKALEPKEIILYEDCMHGLDQCREELDNDLTRWLKQVFGIN